MDKKMSQVIIIKRKINLVRRSFVSTHGEKKSWFHFSIKLHLRRARVVFRRFRGFFH